MTLLSITASPPDAGAGPDPFAPDDDGRRARVLEAAAALLAEQGPHGLSLRRVAARAGGSTQIVYTLFGGKLGLADALYVEGSARLAAAMGAALQGAPPIGSPDRVVALGHGYRAFAATEPAMFAVMFGRAISGFTPARATRAAGRARTLGLVVSAVQECFDAGTLLTQGRSADDLAQQCWLTAHGLASLELAGLLAPDDLAAFVEATLRAPLVAHLT